MIFFMQIHVHVVKSRIGCFNNRHEDHFFHFSTTNFLKVLTLSAQATDVTVSESAVRSHSLVTCEVHADQR